MAHIRSKSKEARDAVTTAAAADLRRANINVDHNSKKKTALSAHMVEYLKNWMMSPEHVDHPYPTEDEKLRIMSETGIVLKQLTNWFVNNRKRFWKPKVEELRRRQSGDAGLGGGGRAGGGQGATGPGGPAREAAAEVVASDHQVKNNANNDDEYDGGGGVGMMIGSSSDS
jgi:hypothetical protein